VEGRCNLFSNRGGVCVMATIEIDQDIHDYLLKRVKGFGETASDVLRRELGLNGADPVASSSVRTGHELAEFLGSPKFRHARGVVGRFLEILSAVYAQDKTKFDIVLAIQGRGRKYFAKSEAEIEKSGNSTQPRQVPGSPYWVMTNSPTRQKKEMLREVLEGLGYSQEAIRAAMHGIDDKHRLS